MKQSSFPDPFRQARESNGLGEVTDQGETVTMLLGHREVRKAAHDYGRFSSYAEPGRIVVPSEVNIRQTRQIPFELDPPAHTHYRAVLEEWFRRPLQEDYRRRLGTLIHDGLTASAAPATIDVVADLALPLQSRALALLLNVPPREAEIWIGWGTHVFRSEGNPLDAAKANILYDYIDAQLDRAEAAPGEDLYSVLLNTEVEGSRMTREEVKGVVVLTFAGGRDTVINALTNTVAWFAEHPDALDRLRREPELVPRAVEELLRYFAPLTHMGRRVAESTEVCGHAVRPPDRISLCWASANRDARVFDRPNEVLIDRQRNPHVSFGFSHHNCLGATHARALLRQFVTALADRVETITLHESRENVEELGTFRRKVGFHSLLASVKLKQA